MPGFEIFGDRERKEVMDVLETGVLFRYGFDQARNGHWKAATFEKLLCEKTGASYAHLCSSGTAALSIALSACGIGAGDEVIVPPFTFVATFEAVLNAGAVPVFSEIDDTLCLDPKKLPDVLTERTKAVIPVHMCGAMARIDEIEAFCRAHNLILIEDACQAIGGTFKGKALGTFGEMGCFSFDAVKTITCGEGGGVITDSQKRYELADQYADHGHDHLGGADRGADDHPILGANYRISELNAAVGVAQLSRLNEIIATQRKNKRRIKEALEDLDGTSFRTLPDPAGDSATFLTFFLSDETKAKAAALALGKAGVDGCFYWYDNNWHYFRHWHHLQGMKTAAPLPMQWMEKNGHRNLPDYGTLSLPQSDAIMKRAISMQIKLSWSDTDIENRIHAIKSVLSS